MARARDWVLLPLIAIAGYAGLHIYNRGTDTSKTPTKGAPRPPSPPSTFQPSVYLGWSYANDAGTPYWSFEAERALVDYAKNDPLMSVGSPDLYQAILGRRFRLLVFENEVVANVRASTTYYFHVGTLT